MGAKILNLMKRSINTGLSQLFKIMNKKLILKPGRSNPFNKYILTFSTILLYISCLLFLNACEQVLIKPHKKQSARDCFETLWKNIDERYTFFELKGINWDSVYSVYSPKIHNQMQEEALFDVLSEMLYILQDGHVNLESPFNLSRNWRWYLDRPENFNFSVLERNYLGENYFISGPFINTLFDKIGYIYYPSFQSGFRSNELDAVLSRMQNCKGIILDIRNNGGGSLGNAELIAERFTDTKRAAITWQFKNGPGHSDLTAPTIQYVSPSENIRFTRSVVLLTNRGSYSASSFFTALMKANPHIISIGDTTGGGGGLPWLSELPNGWIYRFSSSVTQTMNGVNLEPGIPADIIVSMSNDDIAQGRDPILERAMQWIKDLPE